MSYLTFQTLTEEFCAAAGSSTPELVPDENGALAFSACPRDVPVTVIHHPARNPAHVLVLVTYGTVPVNRELDIYRDLLQTNLVMLQPGSPAFSLHPVTQQVILQYVFPLAGATGQQLWLGIDALVDSVRQWRLDTAQDIAPAVPGDAFARA